MSMVFWVLFMGCLCLFLFWSSSVSVQDWQGPRASEEGLSMKEVLVVANHTLGGANLLKTIHKHATNKNVRFRLVMPQSNPSAGLVIYDEAVRESAQARVDLALSLVSGESIDATKEIGDPNPFL